MTPASNGQGEGVELKLVKLLKGCAYELWRASLCAGPQHIRELFDELRNPKVGDLVMETTTHRMESRDPLEGIGLLVAVTNEPMYTPEEWKDYGAEEGEPIPTEKIFTIALIFDDGRHFRWANADFIKVKTGAEATAALLRAKEAQISTGTPGVSP